MQMEVAENVVIVGGGIAGLSTSLGLHRLGIRSLVLESSDSLRVTGFAFTTWNNAWKALDALGIGHFLRLHHWKIDGGEHEVRCVKRKFLLETLAKELPSNTIRFSSKVVSIEDAAHFKLVHLADGTIFKTKVVIGCDGVNSVVGRWLGLSSPGFAGRSAIRGFAEFKDGHGFEHVFLQYLGNGFRSGFLPCDDHTMYWFFTYSPSRQGKDIEDDPIKMKQFVLSKLGEGPEKVKGVVESTDLGNLICSPLRSSHPWELLCGNISKGNVCVTGDALHSMTPDVGQGGCAALEDGVILARCLAQALINVERKTEEEQYKSIAVGLKRFSKERRWRSFSLVTTAYLVGCIQQSDGKVMNFLRDRIFAGFLVGLLLKVSDFDCGKLSASA